MVTPRPGQGTGLLSSLRERTGGTRDVDRRGHPGESGLDSAAVPGTSRQAQPTADMASLPGARVGTPLGTTSVLEGLSSEWKVLHARHWPGRPFDTIDHVAIGPNGVFIVDSVGWRGEVVVTPDALEVNGRVRTAAVHNTQEMAREVALLLPPHLRDHCYPVICLTREEPISGWVKAVRVCTTATLAHLIETRDPVLTTAEVASIGVELDGALARGSHQCRTQPRDRWVWRFPAPAAEPVIHRPAAVVPHLDRTSRRRWCRRCGDCGHRGAGDARSRQGCLAQRRGPLVTGVPARRRLDLRLTGRPPMRRLDREPQRWAPMLSQ